MLEGSKAFELTGFLASQLYSLLAYQPFIEPLNPAPVLPDVSN